MSIRRRSSPPLPCHREPAGTCSRRCTTSSSSREFRPDVESMPRCSATSYGRYPTSFPHSVRVDGRKSQPRGNREHADVGILSDPTQPELPAELDDVMAKNPADRHPTAGQLARHARLAARQPTSARTATPPPPDPLLQQSAIPTRTRSPTSPVPTALWRHHKLGDSCCAEHSGPLNGLAEVAASCAFISGSPHTRSSSRPSSQSRSRWRSLC